MIGAAFAICVICIVIGVYHFRWQGASTPQLSIPLATRIRAVAAEVNHCRIAKQQLRTHLRPCLVSKMKDGESLTGTIALQIDSSIG
jgi:hypothetical protein